ncbi:hypothetical protein DTO013E5_8369 [Penicillium roqueforti]|uniref:Uncharacterized protein n=1 Tax=Penicillium roqueforti (strain FM164) TaxID=1365484 RepID=W6QKF0_PENRF|nr:hypothetical protein DTO013F2_8995 [Penicillium roqueforti]CDM37263.1 hypothetical protein PROQFM164_S06g000224 [Penicillium roqueforti FM164]KAI2743443.1 hypothetical protein DTO012A1_3357 [Penicillium roqueforti]KAI2767110.1 hypothetical protein DTO012A8_7659 [Penicillium roqueforti]KAI3070037.1 hypothetical protein CBS147339_7550 [Penicillium roqueforti]
MDKAILGLTAQKIRELFTICGIEDSEEHLNLVIAHAADHVYKARLVIARGATEPISQAKEATIETPPTPPHDTRGSYRLMKRTGKEGPTTYSDMASTEKKKKKRRKRSHRSELIDQPPGSSVADGNGTAKDKAPEESISPEVQTTSEVDDPESVPDPLDSSLPLHLNSAFEMKVITTILIQCVKYNSDIAQYGQRDCMALATTKLERMREHAQEFSGYSYEQAIHAIRRDTALTTGRAIQTRYNETIFWPIILKCAALIDPATLPPVKGPADGFTMAEKAATKKFMEDTGYSLGAENQRQYRIFWKNIFHMREAGIEKILFYRTKEFDSFCRGYSKTSETPLVDKVLRWENEYLPHFEQLETRITKLKTGDSKRLSYLTNPQVLERLKVPELSWDNASNEWAVNTEEESFRQCGSVSISTDILGIPHNDESVYEGGTDKSAFITLLPKDDDSLFVSSIVPICEGDFLGIFAGTIRFSEDFNVTHGISGPAESLWLDYSQVTGALNQMQVSEPGGYANVCLRWAIFHDDTATEPRVSWRVSVKATKHIMPFHPIVRAAARQEQYHLHLSPGNAKRGFLESATN